MRTPGKRRPEDRLDMDETGNGLKHFDSTIFDTQQKDSAWFWEAFTKWSGPGGGLGINDSLAAKSFM